MSISRARELMVSVTPRPRCHHGNNPQYLFIRKLD